MDYLFGQDYPYVVKRDLPEILLPSFDSWTISWDMLTPNKKLEPKYTNKNNRDQKLSDWSELNKS